MDWKAIARASGLDLSDADLEKVVMPLGALEEALRPLVRGLPPELEPSLEFRAEEEGG
ncbi:MAG: hypothetical protein ABSC23_12235 [Bryobacteraceae bacterium]|jgi:hypothetical protein